MSFSARFQAEPLDIENVPASLTWATAEGSKSQSQSSSWADTPAAPALGVGLLAAQKQPLGSAGQSTVAPSRNLSAGSTAAGSSKLEQRKGRHARLRFAISLALHLAGFGIRVLTLMMCVALNQKNYLFVLVPVWLLVSAFGTIIVIDDEKFEFMQGCLPPIRLAVFFVIFGVLQGAQIKNIYDTYKHRKKTISDFENVPMLQTLNSKTFDGIVQGIPFAVVGFYSFFLSSPHVSCPWYIYDEINHQLKNHNYCNSSSECEAPLSVVRAFFWASAAISLVTLAIGMVEVDYRVSFKVRERFERSIFEAVLLVSYRFAESFLRITNWIVLFVFLRLLLSGLLGDNGVGLAAPALAEALPVFLVWIVYVAVLTLCAQKSSQGNDLIIAHLIIALGAMVVNPARYVDATGYISAARRVSKLLMAFRIFEIVGLCLFVTAAWWQRFPDNKDGTGICLAFDGPGFAKVGDYILHAGVRPLLVQWAGAFVLYVIVAAVKERLFTYGGKVVDDDAILEMIPDEEEGVTVRSSFRGLSSFLLRVGAGLASTFFEKEERQLGDFVIERVLGRGSYGVVVLVRCRPPPDAPGWSTADQPLYAMKLMNTDSRQSATTKTSVLASPGVQAGREKDILMKLQHPLIVRLAYFFDLPSDRQFKDTSSGEVVVDVKGNERFHRAIVMEFCTGGDLDSYIFKHALPPNTTCNHLLCDASLEWLIRARRFSAEMCAALTFLHGKGIMYRDLKPQNVLLKPGGDGEMHTLFADFGFSKMIGGVEDRSHRPADSLAGSPLYAAPEIMAIAANHERAEYTYSVDLFSLGKTILVTLWRTKLGEHQEELRMPAGEEYANDPRVPGSALQLVDQLTAFNPSARGYTVQLQRKAFFSECICSREVLPAIDWCLLERAGC